MAGSKSFFRVIAQTAAAFLAAAVLCIGLLLLTGLIPREAIQSSCRESAVYFADAELFPFLTEGQFNSRVDNYSDCLLVNIMYHVDREDLPASLIRASYYNPLWEQANVSLLDAVTEDREPNTTYFRYWHGALVLLRPLFVFTGINGARRILGTVLIVLTLLVAGMLYRMKKSALAVCYLLGNLAVQMWMCLTCIQYMTTFLVMNGVSLALLLIYRKSGSNRARLDQKTAMLLAVSGVAVCFMDFLTTETIAATVPMLLLLVLRYEDDRLESLGRETLRILLQLFVWGCSYALMFAVKWGLSALVLGKEAFGDSLSHAGVRFLGTVHTGNSNLTPEATASQRFIGAFGRNMGSLFPFRDNMSMSTAIFLFFLAVCLLLAVIYLFRGKNFSGKMLILCLLLGLVPYLRYLVLQNHSYMHYFFTYRAQLVTAVALFYCAWRFGLQNLLPQHTKPKCK